MFQWVPGGSEIFLELTSRDSLEIHLDNCVFTARGAQENVRFKILFDGLQAKLAVDKTSHGWLSSTIRAEEWSRTAPMRTRQQSFCALEWTHGKVLGHCPSHKPLAGKLIRSVCGAHQVIPEFANAFSVIRPSVFASWCPWKLGFYPPMEIGR